MNDETYVYILSGPYAGELGTIELVPKNRILFRVMLDSGKTVVLLKHSIKIVTPEENPEYFL